MVHSAFQSLQGPDCLLITPAPTYITSSSLISFNSTWVLINSEVKVLVMSDSLWPHRRSPPGFSVHGILQARITPCVAICFSGGSSQPKDWNWVSWTLGGFFTIWATKAMAPHSSTLAWKIPWTEEPGRLQSMGSLRVRHNWVTSLSLFTFTHRRGKWQPTPVFLPGESQGRGSPVGCLLWGRTESDTIEVT